MRRLAIVLLTAAASLTAAAVAASVTDGRGATAARVSVGGGVSLRLPHGWHLLRSVVVSSARARREAQAGAVASFPVAFARHPCPCATPNYRTCGVWCEETNISNFPRAGAIVFVWEFPIPQKRVDQGRGVLRHRPAVFSVAQQDPQFAKTLARELRHLRRKAGHACVEGPGSHPSWWSDFDDAGSIFQLEVYLGPAAGYAVRAPMDALLDSFQVASRRSG